ncbi:hypothetical protein EDB86DRAFT_3084087 [Lactarius hatsudake]|nr:hypothetical protein EDB86DRAFT_3084087 [Lactarius hatsudake]
MSSHPPDENPPLEESVPMFYLPPSQRTFEVYPQDTSSVFYFDPNFLYMLPQGLGQSHDGANASQPLESLVHPGDASQFPHPEAARFADLATNVQVIEAPGAGGGNGGALFRCEPCKKTFGRLQELKRHRNQVHKPQRICPFKLCTYKWKRPDKIRAHIIDVHCSELCPVVFKGVSALRGKPKGVVEFVNAYESGYSFEPPAEPYVLPSGPPLEPFEKFGLKECCGCYLESVDVLSSEGVVEQTVEEAAMLPEGI